jgi:hypothetical protein
MRRIVSSAAFVVLIGTPGSSAFSGDLTFTMVNNTNEPIVRLWTSPSTSPDWYEATNIYVPSGRNQRIDYSHEVYGSDCYQDVRFQFQDGTIRKIEHIDLCRISTITIDVDRDGEVTYAKS